MFPNGSGSRSRIRIQIPDPDPDPGSRSRIRIQIPDPDPDPGSGSRSRIRILPLLPYIKWIWISGSVFKILICRIRIRTKMLPTQIPKSGSGSRSRFRYRWRRDCESWFGIRIHIPIGRYLFKMAHLLKGSPMYPVCWSTPWPPPPSPPPP